MATSKAAPASAAEPTDASAVIAAADLVKAKRPLTPMEPRFATKENTTFVPGRRDWIEYKETGITEASKGRMRATILSASGALTKETGWHYHECEMQFSYITKGWVDMQFEDGSQVRFEAGDAMFIPGGVIHNELRTSGDSAGIEVTIPAEMGTVPCDIPEVWKNRLVEAADSAL